MMCNMLFLNVSRLFHYTVELDTLDELKFLSLLQATVREGECGRTVGLPVPSPAATTPQKWCVQSSVFEAVSVHMGPTYMKMGVSPSQNVLVTLVRWYLLSV